VAVGLTAGGFSLFGASWLASFVVGAISHGTYDDTLPGAEPSDPQRFGKWCFVPVFGPFVAIPHRPEAKWRATAGTLGAAQVAGLTMGIIGAVMLSREKRASASASKTTLSLGVSPFGIALHGAF
jgi:hypothetical protein